MTHCFHISSLPALFSSSIKVNNRLLNFPLNQCSVRARLEMLQLSHSGCSSLLYITFIGNLNASTDQKRHQQCCRKRWLQFFCFFWSKPLAGTWSTDLVILHSSTSPPPLPLCLPLFLLILLSSLSLSSVPPAVAAFSSPPHPFLPTSRTQSSCALPLSAVLHSSTAPHTPCSEPEHKSQPKQTENLSTGWILHIKLWNLVAS